MIPIAPIVQIHKTIVDVNSGNILTQTLLPLAAIVISISTAVLAFIQWHLEGRRVVVDAQVATLVAPPPNGGRGCLMLTATNNGRSPAIIKQWGFDNPRELYTAVPGGKLWSLGPDVPHTLPAGASQVWWLDFKEQKRLLDFAHPGDHLLRGFVVLGTRKRKTSRFLISDAGALIPASRARRYISSRLRNRFGIGVLVIGKPGSDYSSMSLQRSGPWLSFTKLRIDVVVENEASHDSSILADSAMKNRFWARRQITFDTQ